MHATAHQNAREWGLGTDPAGTTIACLPSTFRLRSVNSTNGGGR